VPVPVVRWFADRPVTDPTDDVVCDPDPDADQMGGQERETKKLKIKKKACKESSLNLQRA
jgi:hypothetical protein